MQERKKEESFKNDTANNDNDNDIHEFHNIKPDDMSCQMFVVVPKLPIYYIIIKITTIDAKQWKTC